VCVCRVQLSGQITEVSFVWSCLSTSATALQFFLKILNNLCKSIMCPLSTLFILLSFVYLMKGVVWMIDDRRRSFFIVKYALDLCLRD